MRQLTRLVLVGSLAILAACSASEPSEGAAFAKMSESMESLSMSRPYSSIEELVEMIPSVAHDSAILDVGGAEVAVVGRFESVDPVASYFWEMDEDKGEATRFEVPYGDERGEVNLYHLTFDVESELASGRSEPLGERVRVELVQNVEIGLDEIVVDFMSRSPKVIFLNSVADFDDDPSTFGILESGRLVGVVDERGEVRFPAVADSEGVLGRRGSVPLVALEAAARRGSP